MNKKYLLFLLTLFGTLSAQVVKLHVDKLDIVEHSEHYGDEVFLHVLESHGDKVSDTYLPNYPFYFRDGHLDNFQKTDLWEKELPEGEEVTLFISLIEKDAAPWNIDDLIGELTLSLKVEDGKVVRRWEMVDPENLDKVLSSSDKHMSLELFNDNGRYLLDLSLETL